MRMMRTLFTTPPPSERIDDQNAADEFKLQGAIEYSTGPEIVCVVKVLEVTGERNLDQNGWRDYAAVIKVLSRALQRRRCEDPGVHSDCSGACVSFHHARGVAAEPSRDGL